MRPATHGNLSRTREPCKPRAYLSGVLTFPKSRPQRGEPESQSMSSVSVVIPAYNATQYIADALRSVLAQTHTDLEIIVVDDGSKDGTSDLVRTQFPQVTCITKPNGGASNARNVGCRMASGEFIAFLDADDAWHPQKIAAQVALMLAYPQADLCRTTADETPLGSTPPLMTPGQRLPEHTCFTTLKEGFADPFFATSTVMVRKTAYTVAGGFDEQLAIAEDIDFFLKVMSRAPCVPKLSGVACFKRPVIGSLGDDSEAGYVRLLEVYTRFLAEHPQASREMGAGQVRKTLARLWARYAASLYRNGKSGASLQACLHSLTRRPNVMAIQVLGLLARRAVRPGA